MGCILISSFCENIRACVGAQSCALINFTIGRSYILFFLPLPFCEGLGQLFFRAWKTIWAAARDAKGNIATKFTQLARQLTGQQYKWQVKIFMVFQNKKKVVGYNFFYLEPCA